jgi:hypothetical protein
VVNFSAIIFAPFFRQSLRRLDVLRLRALVAAAQQNDDGVAAPLKVDPVARTIVDAQFADPLSDWLHVARVSIRQTV